MELSHARIEGWEGDASLLAFLLPVAQEAGTVCLGLEYNALLIQIVVVIECLFLN